MTCQRKDHFMRNIVLVAQRHKRHLGPYKAARFLSNSVPFEVALRVIAGRQ